MLNILRIYSVRKDVEDKKFSFTCITMLIINQVRNDLFQVEETMAIYP